MASVPSVEMVNSEEAAPHSSKQLSAVVPDSEGVAETFIRAIDDPVKLQELLIDSYRKCLSLEKNRDGLPEHIRRLQEAADTQNVVFKEDLLKQIYEALEQEFKCSICTELFIDPSVLECGHTFCTTCIGQWMQPGEGVRSIGQRQCPICRKHVFRAAVKHLEIGNFLTKIHSMLSPEIRENRLQIIRERAQHAATTLNTASANARATAAIANIWPATSAEIVEQIRSLQMNRERERSYRAAIPTGSAYLRRFLPSSIGGTGTGGLRMVPRPSVTSHHADVDAEASRAAGAGSCAAAAQAVESLYHTTAARDVQEVASPSDSIIADAAQNSLVELQRLHLRLQMAEIRARELLNSRPLNRISLRSSIRSNLGGASLQVPRNHLHQLHPRSVMITAHRPITSSTQNLQDTLEIERLRTLRQSYRNRRAINENILATMAMRQIPSPSAVGLNIPATPGQNSSGINTQIPLSPVIEQAPQIDLLSSNIQLANFTEQLEQDQQSTIANAGDVLDVLDIGSDTEMSDGLDD